MTPSTSSQGAKTYFDNALTPGDYYLTNNHRELGQEIIGNWGGRGAEIIGLSGPVDRESFHALCDNQKPSGERLTPRTKENRRVGYDMTFDCPKSVSVLYALTDSQETKDGILDAFRSSVHETMGEMETEMQTQSWKDEKKEKPITGNMVYAEFVHTTARPVEGHPDPHLHTHAFVFNATYDHEENRWKAGEFFNLKRDAPYYEAAFDARLAEKLASMGYAIEKSGKGWGIAGVPQSVIDKFSRRTAEIEAAAQEKGIIDDKEKGELGARTRQAKNSDLTMAELQTLWNGRLTGEEKQAIFTVGNRNEPPDQTPKDITAKQAVDYALAHSFERNSTLSEKRLMETALRYGVGRVSVERVKHEISDQKKQGTIISGSQNGQQYVTTRAVLNEEKQMIDFAREGRGTCFPLYAGEYQFKSDIFHDPTKDTEEQKIAIGQILSSRDRIIGLRGAAGTGKTTLMQEVAEGIREEGKEIHAFAPSADASRSVLRAEGFDSAETVARLLVDKNLQKRVANQLIWIDEAGLLSTKDMKAVFDIAKRQNARVLLSGDTRQHHSVARGDAQRILEEHAGVKFAAITKIRRQKAEGYRQAVGNIGLGDIEKGFDQLDALGGIREIGDEDRYQQLADDYLQAVEDKKTALVVSPTHREGEKVTHLIRSQLREKGRLSNDEREFNRAVNLNWTQAERENVAHYEEGWVVQFHQNVKSLWQRHPSGGDIGNQPKPFPITKGEKFTVTGRDDSGNVIIQNKRRETAQLPLNEAKKFQVYAPRTIALAAGDKIRITQGGTAVGKTHRLNNGAMYEVKGFTDTGDILIKTGRHGKESAVIGKDFGHIAHGYVTTSHASQGKTVDRVFIAQSADSFPASSREQFYVSISRGRESVKIYTDDKAELREVIQKSSQRLAATELQPEEKQADVREGANKQMAYLVNRLKSYTSAIKTHVTQVADKMRSLAGRYAPGYTSATDREQEIGNEREAAFEK